AAAPGDGPATERSAGRLFRILLRHVVRRVAGARRLGRRVRRRESVRGPAERARAERRRGGLGGDAAGHRLRHPQSERGALVRLRQIVRDALRYALEIIGEGRVRIELFTVEEANKIAAEIRPRLERLVTRKRQFDRIEQRMGILLVATSGAAPDNPDTLELRSLEEKRRRLGESIGKGVQELHAKGVLVKDLDRGLVDFYSLMGDRLVFLCWQVSEA